MLLVVDDVLLLSALGGGATGEVGDAARRGDLYTTGSWYYRLARAAHDWIFGGALSSALDALPADRRERVAVALDAAVRVTTDSPVLNDACRAVGVDVRVVST